MKAKRKTIWTCGSCGNGTVNTTKKAAEQCCVCPECGIPHPTHEGGRVYCETCTLRSSVKNAKAQLTSSARNYAFNVNKLAELEKKQTWEVDE